MLHASPPPLCDLGPCAEAIPSPPVRLAAQALGVLDPGGWPQPWTWRPTNSLEAQVDPAHLGTWKVCPIKDGLPVLLDTYRHGHPRRRKAGGRGDWLAVLVAGPDGWGPITLGPAPAQETCDLPPACEAECYPASAAATDARAREERIVRQQWLTRLLATPGAHVVHLSPEPGEPWLDAVDLVAERAWQERFDDLSPEEVREAVLAEIASDAHGCRLACMRWLRDALLARPGPLLLDARTLPLPWRASWGLPALRVALRGSLDRPLVLRLPPGWASHPEWELNAPYPAEEEG